MLLSSHEPGQVVAGSIWAINIHQGHGISGWSVDGHPLPISPAKHGRMPGDELCGENVVLVGSDSRATHRACSGRFLVSVTVRILSF
jgi:hypothetical protein